MSPNLRPGKTALVFSLVGKGLAKAKRRFFGHGEQHLSLPDLAVSIPVAEYYKHLGGYIDGRLSMSQETRYRLAQATSSYESSKTLLLNNPGLSLATRAAIFASAVTPTFFNIGQWIPEGKAWKTLRLDTPNWYADCCIGMLAVTPSFACHFPLLTGPQAVGG